MMTVEQRNALDKLKAETPWIFPEHAQLTAAKSRVENANTQLKRAQDAWDSLGESKLDGPDAPPVTP
jgi:hypothetical protein